MSGWTTTTTKLNHGDTFTMAGHYERRSLWQWVRRTPKRLRKFTVTKVVP